MRNKILWINPIGSNEFDSAIKDYLNKYKRPNTDVDVYSFETGPSNLEYYSYSIPIAKPLMNKVSEAQTIGYDAVIIGCFYDPFLDEMMEISSIVISAPAQSSMKIASSLGDSFSIIVGRKKWIPKMNENVRKYGYTNLLASFKSIDMGVQEFQTKKEETENRIMKACVEAVEKDDAESIILGCTAEFGFFEEIQERVGVPVVDAVVAPLKYSEFMVDLKNVTGMGHSKNGKYASPPDEEAKNWLDINY